MFVFSFETLCTVSLIEASFIYLRTSAIQANQQPNVMFSSRKLPAYHPRKSSYHPDQLLLRLSIYGFSKLSVRDQRLHTEEIRTKVVENVVVEQLSEETDEGFRIRTFTELLKKLPSAYKQIFITMFIKKFMHERQFGELISTFKHLEANDQQKAIEIIVEVAPEKNLQIPGEADEDFRLRRFTQLCRDHTDQVYKCLLVDRKYPKSGNDHIFLDNLQSRFSDFVSGFSTIWFQGQTPDLQKEMIEKHLGGSTVGGGIVENESEEDFQLRSFTTLYRKKVIYFHAQVEFLDFANERLLRQETKIPHKRLILPQDSESATELLTSLSTFAFSLLYEKEQQNKIEEMSKEVGSSHVTEESDEDFRKARFKELFSELPVSDRIECCNELTEKFKRERRFCESILLFRRLGSQEQIELIQNLFDRILNLHPSSQRFDVKSVIVEKLTEESEEDFRLSRFKKMYLAEPSSVWNWFSYPEAEKLGRKATQQLHISENKVPGIQKFRYAEFFTGFAVIWFKARCSHHPRNPVHVILSGEFYEEDDASEKLSDESEEDFRLRRFREAFEQLEFYSKEQIVSYIKLTLFHDLGCQPINYVSNWSSRREFGGRGLFDPEFFKLKTLNFRGEVITPNPGAGRGRGRREIQRVG